jgi:hypothetical protein
MYQYRLVYPVVVSGGHGTSPALSNDGKLSFIVDLPIANCDFP